LHALRMRLRGSLCCGAPVVTARVKAFGHREPSVTVRNMCMASRGVNQLLRYLKDSDKYVRWQMLHTGDDTATRAE
jgi:hypothetical protein